jgi:ABC-type lipoprotein export system ATPase subunit
MNGASNIILQAENARCDSVSGNFGPVTIACPEGALTLLWGGEGCGKNVLLRLLGLLEAPASGEIFFHGNPTRHLSGESRAGVRNRHFGYLFAEPFLLPSLSVVENIAMPLLKISVVSSDEARNRTQAVLDFVGLPDAMEHRIDELSMFEQHKVALARALVNRPVVLIAENIDAALDGDDLQRFLALLHRAKTELGATPVVTALNEAAVPEADCIARMVDGAIEEVSHLTVKKGDAPA